MEHNRQPILVFISREGHIPYRLRTQTKLLVSVNRSLVQCIAELIP